MSLCKVLAKILVELGDSSSAKASPERAVKVEINEDATILQMVNLALKTADMYEKFLCIDASVHDKEFDEYIYVEPNSKIQSKGVYKLTVEPNEEFISKKNNCSYEDCVFNFPKENNDQCVYQKSLNLLDNPWKLAAYASNPIHASRRRTLISKKPALLGERPLQIDSIDNEFVTPRNGPVFNNSKLNKPPPLASVRPALISEQNAIEYYKNFLAINNKVPFNGPLFTDIRLKTTTEKQSNYWLIGNGNGEEEWTLKPKTAGISSTTTYSNKEVVPSTSYSNYYSNQATMEQQLNEYYLSLNSVSISTPYIPVLPPLPPTTTPAFKTIYPKNKKRSKGHKEKHDIFLLKKGIIPNSMQHLSTEEKKKKVKEYTSFSTVPTTI